MKFTILSAIAARATRALVQRKILLLTEILVVQNLQLYFLGDSAKYQLYVFPRLGTHF